MNPSMQDEVLTDELWQAIIANDASFNDKFFYGVKTTGIFCRPSCKSKLPNRENIAIFENTEKALTAGFRPCKRCKPSGKLLPDNEWVEVMIRYIESHYSETLTLGLLAEISHGSPYHLQRIFKKVMGITPMEYIQHKRVTKASEALLNTDQAIADIALHVGLPNASYFMTLFKKKTGYTPTQFRQLNRVQLLTATNDIKEGSKHDH